MSTTNPATGPPRASGERRDGLVFSGGAAKGAYEVGVMKALFEGASPSTDRRPIAVDIYSGTSAGAYNAAFMVANGGPAVADLEVLRALERVWRERIADTPRSCGNGMYRIRGLPFQGLEAGCLLQPVEDAVSLAGDAAFFAGLFAAETARFFAVRDQTLFSRLLRSVDLGAFFSREPLRELLAETIDPRGLTAGPKKLTIVATDFLRGIPKLFSKLDVAGAVGLEAIAASTAVPGLFSPIEIDGVPYVDGGVTLNTPVLPVLSDGANVVHVVFLDPRIQEIPFPEVPSTLDTIHRLYVIMVADNFKSNLQAARYLALNLRQLRARSPEDEALDLRELAEVNPLVSSLLLGKKPEEPISAPEIHVYRPDSDLGGALGLLDFRLETVDGLIAQGFRDAAAHDCEKEGCVLPGSG